jgi:hypothetical protein
MAASGELMAVDEALEHPIVIEGDTRTVNTFNFTTYDPVSRIGALMTMNSLPGDPTMWRQALLGFHPSGDLLLAKGYGRSTGEPGSANLRYSCREPFKSWDLRFDGFVRRVSPVGLDQALLADGPEEPMSFELTFESVMPAWGHVSDGEVAGTHYEQNGFVQGTWRLAGEEVAYDGVGFRDRIVGPKATALMRSHNWIHGTLRDGRAFALTIVTLKADPGTRMGSACLVEGGRIYGADVVEMPMWDDLADGPGPRRIVLKSEIGEVEIEMEPIQSAPWSYVSSPHMALQPAVFGHDRATSGSLLLWESPARLTWNGDEGHGHIEQSLSVP